VKPVKVSAVQRCALYSKVLEGLHVPFLRIIFECWIMEVKVRSVGWKCGVMAGDVMMLRELPSTCAGIGELSVDRSNPT
jgi:hypothetical protein